MELMKRPGSLTSPGVVWVSVCDCVCVCLHVCGGEVAVSLLTDLKYTAGGFHLKTYLQISVYIHHGAFTGKKNPQKNACCITSGFSQDILSVVSSSYACDSADPLYGFLQDHMFES